MRKQKYRSFLATILLTIMFSNYFTSVFAIENIEREPVSIDGELNVSNEEAQGDNSLTRNGTLNNLNPIKNFRLEKVTRVSTGSAGFDTNDDPGNDSSATNNIVRSFDILAYEMTYSGETSGSDVEMEFELSLNVSKKYAEFDIDVLSGWMTDIVQEDIGGKAVLKGKTIYRPSNKVGIQSFSETKAVYIKVKGMLQGEEVIPKFKVKIASDNSADAWKEKVMSLDNEKAIVSAAPFFDIELISEKKLGTLSTYDFSTGNSGAPNKSSGNIYGRLMNFGVAVRLKSPDNNKGMKGFYIPRDDVDITFKITPRIEGDKTNTMKALLWDYKTNNNATRTGQNGRDLTAGGDSSSIFATTIPLTDNNDKGKDYSVNNGGNINMSQNPDGSISVTISGASLYDLNGNIHAPTMKGDKVGQISPTPSQGNVYLSTMFFELVAPVEKNATNTINYTLIVSDEGMNVPYEDATGRVSTTTNDDQTVKNNDNISIFYKTESKGSYGIFHYYVKENQQKLFWSDNLSTSKSRMGLDVYALQGNKVQVVGTFSYEGDNINKNLNAANILMRIDDEAIQPSNDAGSGKPTSNSFRSNVNVKLLYAAKPGGTGWVSDDEMKSTNEEDLEYFKSMSDLKKRYPNGVCVAVLAEARNISNLSPATQYGVGFNVDILENANPKVYQFVQTTTFYDDSKKLTVNDSRLNNSEKLKDYTDRLRAQNVYEKAVYNESGVTNASSANSSYVNGDSLLVVGVEAGVEKTTSNGQTTFDLSSGVSYIPYKIKPMVNVSKNKIGTNITEVKVTDILPANLKVTNDTKFYYGDNEITPTLIEKQGDGTTKIIWTLKNVKTGIKLPEITFNAEIDIEKMDLSKAKHEVETNTYIDAKGDDRVFNSEWASNPNHDTVRVTLIANRALNLSKSVDKTVSETNNDINYNISFTNTNNVELANYKMVDILPFDGDGRGSSFDGTYKVNARLKAPAELDLYVSTDLGVRGKDAESVTDNLFKKVNPSREENGYKYYEFNEKIYALMVKGKMPVYKNYILDITLSPEGNSGNNIYANSASMKADSLNKLTTAIVKTEIIERKLSGIVWIDDNKNNIIDSSDRKLSNLKVKLYHLNSVTGLEEVARDSLGNEVVTTTDSQGLYEFKNLNSGEYRVEFLDENGNPISLKDYTVSSKNSGSNAAINSKADQKSNNNGEMIAAEISNIELPSLETMKKDGIKIYTKEHQNLGLSRITVNKSVRKIWNDSNNTDRIRPASIKVQLLANGKNQGAEVVLNEANGWQYTWNNLPKKAAGQDIDYTVKETVVVNGYTVSYRDDGTGNNFTITNSYIHKAISREYFEGLIIESNNIKTLEVASEEYSEKNNNRKTLPYTGKENNNVFLAFLFICGGSILLFNKRKI